MKVLLDDSRHIVTVGRKEVDVPGAEYEILRALLASDGKLLSRQDIIAQVGRQWDLRTIDQHIKRLRGKIGRDRIKTVLGYGYRWVR